LDPKSPYNNLPLELSQKEIDTELITELNNIGLYMDALNYCFGTEMYTYPASCYQQKAYYDTLMYYTVSSENNKKKIQ
jgi:hypothetical protein